MEQPERHGGRKKVWVSQSKKMMQQHNWEPISHAYLSSCCFSHHLQYLPRSNKRWEMWKAIWWRKKGDANNNDAQQKRSIWGVQRCPEAQATNNNQQYSLLTILRWKDRWMQQQTLQIRHHRHFWSCRSCQKWKCEFWRKCRQQEIRKLLHVEHGISLMYRCQNENPAVSQMCWCHVGCWDDATCGVTPKPTVK